jgi:hypothetical protein
MGFLLLKIKIFQESEDKLAIGPLDFSKTKSILSRNGFRTQPIDRTNDAIKEGQEEEKNKKKIGHN